MDPHVAAQPPRSLPPLPNHHVWPREVIRTWEHVDKVYTTALRVLRTGDDVPVRLRLQADELSGRAYNIMRVLGCHVRDERYLQASLSALATLEVALRKGAVAATAVDTAKVVKTPRAADEDSGMSGRPRKVFDDEWLHDALGPTRKISKMRIAEGLGVHRNTLYKYLRANDMVTGYSDISDDDLDFLVKYLKERTDGSGISYVMGELLQSGIRVQRERIRSSLARVDGLGQILRRHANIQRERYEVTRPHAIWHIDGHHKLIRWGIIVSGGVDGATRTIVYMDCVTNNRTETHFRIFLDAAEEHGLPSRVRGDRGGENLMIATYMIQKRGEGRASFMWGSSTRNTRIERLWAEVGGQFARQWRGFFQRLERIHYLQVDEASHLWVLHEVFLPLLRADGQAFRRRWNHHPIGGLGRNMTPLDMMLLGQLENGHYVDEYADEDPGLLNRYYAVDDYDENGEVNVVEIMDHQRPQIRHDAVATPDSRCPFDAQQAAEFRQALQDALANDRIPFGVGVTEGEWQDRTYPEYELVKVGRRKSQIALPVHIWWPRAVAWAKGLEILVYMQRNN